mmetsp:Transcript_78875/g.156806  ORF Transcript_78875/g.156806 Transcript_78875/m.156806 type:complete len:264 (+) Transcript_78875:3691-4482(+)
MDTLRRSRADVHTRGMASSPCLLLDLSLPVDIAQKAPVLIRQVAEGIVTKAGEIGSDDSPKPIYGIDVRVATDALANLIKVVLDLALAGLAVEVGLIPGDLYLAIESVVPGDGWGSCTEARRLARLLGPHARRVIRVAYIRDHHRAGVAHGVLIDATNIDGRCEVGRAVVHCWPVQLVEAVIGLSVWGNDPVVLRPTTVTVDRHHLVTGLPVGARYGEDDVHPDLRRRIPGRIIIVFATMDHLVVPIVARDRPLVDQIGCGGA